MIATLFEVCFLRQNQEEIYHFAGWEGRGLRGTKKWDQTHVNKLVRFLLMGFAVASRLFLQLS